MSKGSQSFAAQKKEDAGRLFNELNSISDDPKKILQICDGILKLLPGDEDAVAYTVHTLVEANRFNECIKFVEDQGGNAAKKHGLRLAYSYYRMNKLDQAQAALAGAAKDKEEESEARQHLTAQIAYKKENFAQAVQVLSAVRTSQGEDDEELLCNLSAAFVGAGSLSEGETLLNMPDGDLTHDLLYNKACVLIAKGNLRAAEATLVAAEKDLTEAYRSEGSVDEEALADDLATTRVQLAYLVALQGDTERAVSILTDVLHIKPSSLATLAVGSNNLCALLQHERTVFDAFKRMKPLRSANIDSKVSHAQRLSIRYNTAILLSQMGQKEQARSHADSIAKDKPASPLGFIAQASILCTEGKFNKAEELLKAFLDRAESGEDLTQIKLLLAQIALRQGDAKKAVSLLESVDRLRHQLGVVATLVAAYEKQGNIDAAEKTIDDALAHWRSVNHIDATENTRVLTAEAGAMYQRSQRWADAVKRYEAAQKIRKDTATTARLAMCLARTDIVAAEGLCQDLDERCPASEITPAQAERLLQLKVREHLAAQAALPQKAAPAAQPKRKRGKGAKPKNLVAGEEPNPERWWASKDRASYKVLTKRELREQKKERQENRNRFQRMAGRAREEQKEKLKVHYEALREAAAAASQ